MQLLNVKKRRAQIILSNLTALGIIRREGISRNTKYVINQ